MINLRGGLIIGGGVVLNPQNSTVVDLINYYDFSVGQYIDASLLDWSDSESLEISEGGITSFAPIVIEYNFHFLGTIYHAAEISTVLDGTIIFGNPISYPGVGTPMEIYTDGTHPLTGISFLSLKNPYKYTGGISVKYKVIDLALRIYITYLGREGANDGEKLETLVSLYSDGRINISYNMQSIDSTLNTVANVGLFHNSKGVLVQCNEKYGWMSSTSYNIEVPYDGYCDGQNTIGSKVIPSKNGFIFSPRVPI